MWLIPSSVVVALLLAGALQEGGSESSPGETLEIPLKFSHRTHLKTVGMGCEDCHHGLDEVDLAGPGNLPRMVDCLVCHQPERSLMAECGRCHPSGIDLRPQDHRTEGFFDNHPAIVADLESRNCDMCHTPGYIPCTQCH